MQSLEGFRKSGVFTVGSAPGLAGDLALDGESTSLDLHSKEFFTTGDLPNGCILGALHDLTKVSLHGCITTEGPGRGGNGTEEYHFSKVFPHFVLFGCQHLKPGSAEVTHVSFSVSDGYVIFNDFAAFGQVTRNLQEHMELVAKAELEHGQRLSVGDHPLLFYFSGKYEIFSAKTAVGTVSATHAPSYSSPGPRGIKVENKIRVNIEFDAPIDVDGAIRKVLMLLRFLEIVAGRKQRVEQLTILTAAEGGGHCPLDVYWSMNSPGAQSSDSSRGPNSYDLPIQAAREPAAFSAILTRWVDRDAELLASRARFSTAFGHQRSYNVDRLVGAANMFDILPPSLVPSDVQLTPDMEDARAKARILFKELPISPERDSVLGVLGRLGQASLKQKVRSRAAVVTQRAGAKFPELELVVDEAVNCRNHFVHGSGTKMDYEENFDQVTFFTDTLEFVFAASDLIECGWNATLWSQKMSSLSHPFDRFLKGYDAALEELKRVLHESKQRSKQSA